MDSLSDRQAVQHSSPTRLGGPISLQTQTGGGLIMANKFTDAVFECDVKGTDKLLLFILGGFADNEKGECWPSYKTLAKRAGLGYSTIQDSLKRLIGAGFVSVVGRHQIRNTDQYTLILRLNLEKLQEHVLATTTSGSREPCTGKEVTMYREPGSMYRDPPTNSI